MIALTDVHYGEAIATAALVVAREWSAEAPFFERVVTVSVIEPYRSGEFFKRELAPLRTVLSSLTHPVDAILVDGFVWLAGGQPGLGAHLWNELTTKISVVGIAKRPFRGAPAVEVVRGDSARPLYVTAAGMDAGQAAALVRSMHGSFRIPTLVTWVDHLARGLEQASRPKDLD